MSEIFIVLCPEGFSDNKVLSQGVRPGGVVEVSPDTFRQMKQSSPHVEIIDRKLELNPGAIAAMKGDPVVREATPEEEAQETVLSEEVVEWKPIPWYAAQLAKATKEEEDGGEA